MKIEKEGKFRILKPSDNKVFIKREDAEKDPKDWCVHKMAYLPKSIGMAEAAEIFMEVDEPVLPIDQTENLVEEV
jgi:hypothetical protein